jgi:hypothetical protein
MRRYVCMRWYRRLLSVAMVSYPPGRLVQISVRPWAMSRAAPTALVGLRSFWSFQEARDVDSKCILLL